ncbi:hypothetical protein DB30_08102 [Enhygromyxa salina]|uniref:Uncharacterized protein n=1 Tax=Enhygromyxa salina TaxID=215803 RepID=A0A0C2CQF9_9BACT|nr:hypothetical protein DB30_08102 [Enhygromyxa salina]
MIMLRQRSILADLPPLRCDWLGARSAKVRPTSAGHPAGRVRSRSPLEFCVREASDPKHGTRLSRRRAGSGPKPTPAPDFGGRSCV